MPRSTSTSSMFAALAWLLLVLFAPGCLGIRVEGGVIEAQAESEEVGAADEAAQELENEKAFEEIKADVGKATEKVDTVHAAKEAEDEGAKGDDDEVDEVCDDAVAGATKSRRRCDCGKNLTVVCPNEACTTYGRYFKPEAFAEKAGCECKVCDTSCEAVPGATKSSSLWKRMWGKGCECAEGAVLAGDDAACKSAKGDKRHFKAKGVVDRGCFCSAPGTVPEEPKSGNVNTPVQKPPVAVEVTMPKTDNSGDNTAKEEEWGNSGIPSNIPHAGKTLAMGMGVILAAACCTATVLCLCRGGEDRRDMADSSHYRAS